MKQIIQAVKKILVFTTKICYHPEGLHGTPSGKQRVRLAQTVDGPHYHYHVTRIAEPVRIFDPQIHSRPNFSCQTFEPTGCIVSNMHTSM
jgi:hypothetical protein